MSSRFESVTITPECYDGTVTSAGSVVFNFTEVNGAVSRLGGSAILRSAFIHDSNDNTRMINIIISRRGTNDLGTLNAAIDITDPEAVENDIIGGFVFPNPTAGASPFDLINSTTSVATPNIIVSAAEGSSSIFIAATSAASSFASTVDGLRITLGFERL